MTILAICENVFNPFNTKKSFNQAHKKVTFKLRFEH